MFILIAADLLYSAHSIFCFCDHIQLGFRPRPHVSGYFWKSIFFIRVGLASTKRRHFPSQKMKFLKTVPQSGSFWKCCFPVVMQKGENRAFQNADITASIYNPSEHVLRSLGTMWGHFILSVFIFQISQHFCVDRDNFENAPHVDADILL